MKKLLIVVILSSIIFSCSSESDLISSSETSQASGQGGSLATFALKGNYLYVVDEFDLNVFKLQDNGEPVAVNKVQIGFNIETLFGYKDYLYIGSRNGMFIYSLSDPESPQQLSSVQHFTACDPVVANDSLAFVTLHSNTFCGNNINLLEIYDISVVTQPVLISSRNLISPKGLGLFQDYLIVCDDEIKIFDVSDSKNIRFIKSIDREAFDVIIRGNLLIAIGKSGLYQYELESKEEGVDYTFLSAIDI